MNTTLDKSNHNLLFIYRDEEEDHSPLSTSSKKVTKLMLEDLNNRLERTLVFNEDFGKGDVERGNDFMALRNPQPIYPKVPFVKLAFCAKEMTLINSIFENWSLGQHICLLELWAFDLFSKLNQYKAAQIETAHSKIDCIIENFSADFFIGYTSLLARQNRKKIQRVVKQTATTTSIFVFRREWVERLKNLKNALVDIQFPKFKKAETKREQLRSKIENRVQTAVVQLFHDCDARLDLGISLLSKKLACIYLVDHPLRNIEKIFPWSFLLEREAPEKEPLAHITVTYTHLRYLAQFFHFAIYTVKKLGRQAHEFTPTCFDHFDKALKDFWPSRIKDTAVKRLKLDILTSYNTFRGAMLVIRGINSSRLSKGIPKEEIEQFVKMLSLKTTNIEPTEEMNDLVEYSNSCSMVCDRWFKALHGMVEDRLLEVLHPKKYVPVQLFINRLNLNVSLLECDFRSFELPRQGIKEIRGVSLSKEQLEQLSELEKTIEEAVLLYYQALAPIVKPIIILQGKVDLRNALEAWVGLVAGVKIVLKALNSNTAELVGIRKVCLALCAKFMDGLNREQVVDKEGIWFNFFRYVFQKASLNLIRIKVIEEDVHAISVLCGKAGEGHVIAEPIQDFFNGVGLKDMITKISEKLESESE